MVTVFLVYHYSYCFEEMARKLLICICLVPICPNLGGQVKTFPPSTKTNDQLFVQSKFRIFLYIRPIYIFKTNKDRKWKSMIL